MVVYKTNDTYINNFTSYAPIRKKKNLNDII